MSQSPDQITFESVWEEFQSRVRPYNTQQKRIILRETMNAFQQILNSMPAPRREGADPTPSPTTAMVAEIESLIFDRLLQLNQDKSLFLRWDTKSTGLVTADQFRASISSLGISLTDEEMEALIAKYDSNQTGQINYSDFWKYLQAAAETPRTTNQSAFSSSILNRPAQTGKEFASLVRDIPESLEERIARGLKTMRESMYQKSSNFHGFFNQLQNPQTKQVKVDDVVPALAKLGFPAGLATEEELKEVAMRYSIRQPGFFTYGEFLAFFTGHDAKSVEGDAAEPTNALDSPALMNCLVKVNNINLRKFFKDLDQDNDGLISVDELGRGLVESGGLHEAITRDQSFREYVETFCVRKTGFLGYAEFIKFIGTRVHGNQGQISGQPLSGAHSSVKIPEDYTPSAMLELIVKTLRSSQISVESIFDQFDSDLDGFLSEEEFFQGVSALGFTLTQQQSKAFFDAVDTNKSGTVDISEFASLIVNPGKNPKLSTRVRHAPGGASSVPMGSYASADAEVTSRPGTGRVAGRPMQQFDLSSTQTPLTAEEEKARQAAFRPGVARTGLGDSKLDLSFNEQAIAAAQAQRQQSPRAGGDASASPSTGEAPSTNARGRNPPGGKSSINFGGDHGAPLASPKGGPNANKQSVEQFLHFDPAHPVDQVKNARVNPGAVSSIQLKDEQAGPATPARTIVRPMHSPGGESSVSFNQSDSEILRSSRRVLQAPGGSNVSLKFEDVALSPEPVAATYRDQDATSIDLKFDPNGETEQQRRVRRAGQFPNVGSVNLAHSSSRVDSELNEPNGLTTKTRRHLDAPPTAVALGNDSGSQLLASYKDQPQEIDTELIEKLSKAIYANSQRLRHSFQAFNKNSQSATLSKENFVAGARSLKVDLTDAQADALFARFDADGDGAITYSEYVRLLASK